MEVNQNTDNVTELVTNSCQVAPSWKIKESVLVALVCINAPFVMCCNFFIVITVLTFKHLQLPANYLILSLSLADVIVAMILPVYIIVEVSTAELYCSVLGIVLSGTLKTTGSVSMLTVAMIAYDRYIAIIYPLEYIRKMTKRRIWIVVILSYMYSVTVTWLPELIRTYQVETHSIHVLSENVNESKILSIVIVFLPSCFCVIFCYSKIFLIARQHAKKIAKVSSSFQQSIGRKIDRTDKKYTKTIAIVIAVFLILWTPYQIVQVMEVADTAEVSPLVETYSMFLAYANSGVNPWIYAYRNKDFRSAFTTLLRMRKSKANVGQDNRRSSVLSGISILSSGENIDT